MWSDAERRDVRRLLRRGTLFALPFVIYAALVVAVDPFHYFGVSDLIDDKYKRDTASSIQYALWRTIAFQRDPKPNILLGDSRMGQVRSWEIEEMTGERWFNFAYGGGTIPELADTFHWAAGITKLEKVFVGVSLVNMNAYQNQNRFRESQAILANPLLYGINRNVLRAGWLAVISQARGEVIRPEKPPSDPETFWQYQLGYGIATHYGRYRYSIDYFETLRELARYCADHAIALTFVIPPTHVELQAKIAEFGLTEINDAFLRDLRTLGPVIDMDFPNWFTSDRANFKDPFHTGHSLVLQEALFGANPDPAVRR